ncbi:MAG: pyridine nucleotide-disulfide oxidoreductase, partial [Planctomycetes bacterium]|nr:pyridine nucleotide-disulfide oxidoreductase [Planctomycetota bacterium]
MSDPSRAWKCGVCGYVHREAQPPEFCPICGALRSQFEPFTEPVQAKAAKVERWRCLNCGYIHVGPQPPKECPVCGAPADRFEPLREAAEKTAHAGQTARVVIVGAGIAGVAAAESVRAASPAAEVLLISKERELPYYRLNLTRYLAGEIGERELPIHPEGWYKDNNIQLRRGEEVAAVELGTQAVQLRGGAKERFEKLILAAGAHPFIPPIPGAYREGATSLRTVQDAQAILDAAKSGGRCVCLGGGVLGLETAGALARRGADVTVLEGFSWLLPRQLNQRAAAILERYLGGLRIKVRTNVQATELVGDERVRGVRLADKTISMAELVIVTTGIRSNSYLARLAGLDVNQGVVVNNLLSSSHPNVLAAGDVAEHRGVIYGIWGPSQYQGSIAGMNAVGLGVEFGGIPRSNTLKVLGLDLFSIGLVEPEDASYTAIDQETDGKYFRFLF